MTPFGTAKSRKFVLVGHESGKRSVAERVPQTLLAPLADLAKWLEATGAQAVIVGGIAVSFLGDRDSLRTSTLSRYCRSKNGKVHSPLLLLMESYRASMSPWSLRAALGSYCSGTRHRPSIST